MSIAGGIAGIFVEGKNVVRKKAISDMLSDAAGLSLPFLRSTAGDLKTWGQEDWDHFKQSYRPVADALVDDANQTPDYNRYEKEATVSAARGAADAGADILGGASATGVGPSSGRFAAATTKLAAAKGANEGIGRARGRLKAEQVQTNKKLDAIRMGRPDPGSSIAGLGVVTRGGNEYRKYSAAIGNQATQGLAGVGKGIGQVIGGYKPSTDYNGPNATPPNEAPNEAVNYNAYDDAGYAAGGIIEGPGTGRSDSIPAVIDGQRPARVSNGEYHISADVVAKIGKPRLDALISISRG